MARRKRYHVHQPVKNGRPLDDLHVLAYSKENAEDTLREKGYGYAAVVPYDALVKAMLKEHGGYKLDTRAIYRAIEFLDIKLPVRIRFSSKAGVQNGNHLTQRREGRIEGPAYHNIMLKSYLSAEQASKTLWHELAHAMQFEREATAAGIHMTDPVARVHWSMVRQRDRGVGYRKKSIEVEARSYEAFAETDPLAVKP